MGGTRAEQWGRAHPALGSRPGGAVWAVVLCVAVLLGGCNTPTTPGATAAPGPTVVAHGASVALAPPFDPGVGAPLPYNRIVAAYGIAGGVNFNGPASNLGLLNGAMPHMQQLAQQFAALDPTHPVKLALDLVINTFDLCATPRYCSTWAFDDIVQGYISYCQQHDMLLFFDLQLGTEPVADAVTNHVSRYLQQYPFVELALDTEFHFPDTPYGHSQAAAYARGQMHAAEINWAINQLAQISLQQKLPRKVLLVHEFDSYILPDKNLIQPNPNVSLVLQTDGWGGYSAKLDGYTQFVQRELLEYGGYKIFNHYDNPYAAYDVDANGVKRPQTPEEVMQLFPQPLFISYQ
jgi:hypothetical protein